MNNGEISRKPEETAKSCVIIASSIKQGKSMKYIVMLMVVMSVTACGQIDRLGAAVSGYSKVCVDGVSYIQFTSGASVQYDKDGKVVTCK